MIAVLYHPTGGPSARRLAKFMGVEAASSLASPTRPHWLIRYGSAKKVPLKPSKGVVNPRWRLASYSNRLEQLVLLQGGGVPVPHFAAGWHSLSGFPVLARDFPDGKQNTGGKGITIYPDGFTDQPDGTPEHDMYMTLVPKDRQFRVHVIGSNYRVRELMPPQPGLPEVPPVGDGYEEYEAGFRSQPIWNYNTGFTYRVPESDVPSPVIPLAAQAVAALGLDFGAVDIIMKGMVFRVLEVNTAPGLCDSTLEWYSEKIGQLVGIEPGQMPGWNVLEKEDHENHPD